MPNLKVTNEDKACAMPNKPFKVHFYHCDDETYEHEWSETIVLHIQVRVP